MKRTASLAPFEARCREKGLALTIQRRAVLEDLAPRKDHPTADQVYETVGPKVPGLSRTTVYRVLDTLARSGVIREVGHLGPAMRYDPHTGRHHHLLCTECGCVTDHQDDRLDGFKLPTGTGFEIEDYSVYFKGKCPDCRRKAAR